ncbi:hypothetical protein IV203_023192 [Nitzschia inconspicua]|uniref:Uncharacterized protein n=1 Tax=Nitzschia inconspicua TaxID=303405 RepID=A0A9K3KD66_9STRA|nr:hypothetical protein IV203_023192 [Nitzschia inconspicua]
MNPIPFADDPVRGKPISMATQGLQQEAQASSSNIYDAKSSEEYPGVDPNLRKYFDEKFDTLGKNLDENFVSLGNKLDKTFDNMNKMFDNMGNKLDKMNRRLNLLVSVSPAAAMERIKPASAMSLELEAKAILEGREYTWSFRFGAMRVVLPANSGSLSSPHKYKVFDAKNSVRRIAGMSHSGMVSGKNVVFKQVGGHFVCVEDSEETGNCGALMFGWNDDIDKAKLVGLYHGLFPVGGKICSRNYFSNGFCCPCGVVVPLPDPKECTWFDLHEKTPTNELFAIFDGKGLR